MPKCGRLGEGAEAADVEFDHVEGEDVYELAEETCDEGGQVRGQCC